MTRRAGEPPDDLYRTSLALRPTWANRLKSKLASRDISLGEQVRRWIDLDDWVTEHTSPQAKDKLFLHTADGRQVEVRLAGRSAS